ncbi:MAG: sulfite exporter TauE/SafE family protein [Acidimicrobiales bacterium]
MTPLGYLGIAGAGLLAGTINTIVGSGSLLTFPTLVGLGYSPLVANVSNTVGLVPGGASGAFGYRHELAGQRDRVVVLGACAITGGVVGAVLLLVFPSAFQVVVPWLVLVAVAMVLVQPRLSRYLAKRGPRPRTGGWLLRLGVGLTGVYGGYFGAAQGVLLIGLLALGFDDELQKMNGLKNALTPMINGVAAIIFMALAPVSWTVAGILAGSSIIGGQVGAKVGRKLPAPVLRAVIVVAGIAVAVKLLLA